jgi:hypothetical protein
MALRTVGGIDLDTGEVMPGMAVWVGPKIRSPYGRRFYMSSQDALEALAKDPDMTGQVYRVFLYLCSRLDFENYIQVPQIEICKELNIGKARVSDAIALLETKGVLLRGPKVGHSSVFRLNPTFGWKGKVTSLNAARAEQLKVVKSTSRPST